MIAYTIKSAKWSNSDRTAILLLTEEAGWVLKTADMNPREWEDILALPGVEQFVPREAPTAERDLAAELDTLKAVLLARNLISANDVAVDQAAK